MDFETFRHEARRMFQAIPPGFRAGVRALRVERSTEPHPEIPTVHTLGECYTDEWPSAYGGEGEVQSELVLYHGSFAALAGQDPGFDWDAELWETILHELLHHREAAAGAEALDVFDWAVDQNQRRHEGLPWDPAFVEAIPPDEEGVRRLDSEIFVDGTPAAEDRGAPEDRAAADAPADRAAAEDGKAPEDDAPAEAPVERAVEAREDADGRVVRFGWRARRYALRAPLADGWTYVRVPNLAGGRLWVVVRAPRPLWRRWLGLVGDEALEVERSARRASGVEPGDGGGGGGGRGGPFPSPAGSPSGGEDSPPGGRP